MTPYKDPEKRKKSSYERVKKWRSRNLDKSRDYQNNWKKQQRLTILKHYSQEKLCCTKCGVSDIRVLTLDHVNGGGHKQIRETHTSLPQWIINNNFPEGFQVLCYNCQFIKAEENNEWRTKY